MIKQAYVSNNLSFFKSNFLKSNNLRDYFSKNEPSFFFGCYTDYDFNMISTHKSKRIIILGGSDSDIKNNKKSQLKNLRLLGKNTYFLSISDYIKLDLNIYRINNTRICLSFSNKDIFLPVSKYIYIYIYIGSIKAAEFYGCDILERIMKMTYNKYKFIITKSKKKENEIIKNRMLIKYPFLREAQYVSPENIYDLYKKCFIGLRLTKHDGNANTVQELGLCGIKCLYNGDSLLPNAIKWNNIKDIVNIIDKEYKTVGETDIELSNKVKEYFEKEKKWLNLDFYGKDKNYEFKRNFPQPKFGILNKFNPEINLANTSNYYFRK